jgi:hypothetical protein
MHAVSNEELPLMVRKAIGISSVMITVPLWGEELMCADTLDPNETFH